MNDPKALAAALSSYVSKFDLVGPSVDDDIRRAVLRYGAEAVKEAVKRQVKMKAGRKPAPDWPELSATIIADAKEWLAGGDPFKTRTNYSIAKEFAANHKGQAAYSTHQRIERKLRNGPYNRRWRMLAMAERISRKDYPFTAHLRALEELAQIGPPASAEMSLLALQSARLTLEDYERKVGKRPPSEMSISEIEDVVRNAFTPTPSKKMNGLFAIGLTSPPLLGE